VGGAEGGPRGAAGAGRAMTRGHAPEESFEDPRRSLERAVAGALSEAIWTHGPITHEWIGSAVKRVLGQLKNVPAEARAEFLAPGAAKSRRDRGEGYDSMT